MLLIVKLFDIQSASLSFRFVLFTTSLLQIDYYFLQLFAEH